MEAVIWSIHDLCENFYKNGIITVVLYHRFDDTQANAYLIVDKQIYIYLNLIFVFCVVCEADTYDGCTEQDSGYVYKLHYRE